ncbi:Amidohydrolase family protein [Klebsormidium nitens]|uniref:Amidohydrolase family protein n=1 Tax=Klebsormidium nitens TaxID=105231 RepID=A0A1Y1IAE3_KLENI|nr:Amidohydrolase family protein [Klebsormidium nitens]|eukprot:GAQ86399.1 Amidohydrolase family protein [Klebsormidium nitens]
MNQDTEGMRNAVQQPRPRVLDSHLHVWASEEESKTFPYNLSQKPTIPGNTDLLLQEMDVAGVDGALIVQPFDHKFDHSYVSSALKKHPNKFAGCLLADPTPGGGGTRELERLVQEDGFSAVRFNPYLWPAGEQMTNDIGRAMFAKAGQLGAPVGFMCFKGLHLHIDDIEALCRDFPETKVLLDHFAFTNPQRSEQETTMWDRLLTLSQYPQVYVKLSAFFRVSKEEFPYRDTVPMIRQLADAFGARRLLWGSDFPYVTQQCGYTKNWQILDETDVLNAEGLELVRGEALAALFPSKWQR